MNDWLQTLFNGDFGPAPVSLEAVCFMMLLAFVIGQLVGWIYMITHEGLSYSRTFVSSLVVLPVIVTLMMVLMASSVVIAFGLLAVFAVVRFRNVLKDTRDTSFILWAILEGLGIGTWRYSTALIGALGVTAVLLYLRLTSFGARHRYDAVLDMLVPSESPILGEELASILRQHCSRSQLANSQVMGPEGLRLSYRVLLRDPNRAAELRSALESTSNVSDVNVFVCGDESEI
jgi:hypothetical protein